MQNGSTHRPMEEILPCPITVSYLIYDQYYDVSGNPFNYVNVYVYGFPMFFVFVVVFVYCKS